MNDRTQSVEPVGIWLLIKHDKERDKTHGGIILPDNAKVTTLTGCIVGMSDKLKEDKLQYPFDEYNRVIYDIRERVPVDLLPGNEYFLVKADSILAVVKEKDKKPKAKAANTKEPENRDES